MSGSRSHDRTGVALRRRSEAVLGSAACLLVVTAAIYLLREAVPVLSLGALYVFAVLPVAIAWGRAWAVGAAIASMLAFNFLFLPPEHTFRVAEGTNWLALAVYLVTGLVVSELAARARRRAAEAERREREEALLAELSIALLQGEQLTNGREAVSRAVSRILGVTQARLELGDQVETGESELELRAGERLVARLAFPAGEEPDAAARERFLPALASLLAVAADREALQRDALKAERLRVSDSVKTAILRSVGHDLRSPLTAIRVAGESLASPALALGDEDRRHLLETIKEESLRLDRLVANLLDLSRLETGAVAPRKDLVAIDELVAQALAQLGRHEASVRVELPSDEIPLVEVDAIQVERALVNLLDNGLRYSPENEDVTVRITASPSEVVLRVENGGPPVAEHDLERIFEPFVRASQDEGRRQGTGLGLAIARGFTEANGGRIWAERPGSKGACFAIAFPLATAPVRAEA